MAPKKQIRGEGAARKRATRQRAVAQRAQWQAARDLELEIQQGQAAAILQKATQAPTLLTPSDVLHLQRAVGNRAAGQLLPATQPPAPQVQRQAEEEDLQAKPLLQRQEDAIQPAGDDLEARLAGQAGQGSPLAEDARAFMEPRFGADFGGVRVHTGGEAEDLAQDLEARAFTHGRDIYFAQGGYDPGTQAGERLLAHELTHVVQQGAAKPAPAKQAGAGLAGRVKRLARAGTIQRGRSKIKEGAEKKEESAEKERRRKKGLAFELDPSLARLFRTKTAQLPALGQEIGLPVQQQVQQAPYRKIRDEINTFIQSGGGGRKPVWSMDDFEDQWGEKSSTRSAAIARELGNYHAMPENADWPTRQKGYKAEDIRNLIAKWKKAHPIGLFYKDKRKVVTTLDGQLAGEEKRLNDLVEAFSLVEPCQTAEKIHNQPLPQGRKYAIQKITGVLPQFKDRVLNKLKSPTTGPGLLLKVQVERSISSLERQLETMKRASQKAKLPGLESDKRRKKVEDEIDKRMAEKGLGAKTGQVSMYMTAHKLEALDPKHRDYDVLHDWFGRWTEEDWPGETLDDFFKWLENYEVPEMGAELSRTRYITTEDERKKYKLGFPGGLPFYTERRKLYRAQMYNVKLSVPERRRAEHKAKQADKPLTKGIYVMTPAKEFYARREDPTRKQTFHHSSFLAGLPVAAAGHMSTAGRLKIDLESGHYAPRTLHMLNAVRGLEGKGLALDKFEVSPIPSEYRTSPVKMVAKDFLQELQALKKSNGQEGGRMKMIANQVPIVMQQLTEAYKAV